MRIITDLAQKIKFWVEDIWEWILIYEKPLYHGLLLFAVALLAFGLGRLGQINTLDTPFYLSRQIVPIDFGGMIEYKTKESPSFISSSESSPAQTSNSENKQIVASKNSTKYHLPWCSGAKSIKPENRIYFSNEAEAIASGRSKAGNCK